ncbi:hypothetical protein SBA3_4730004 [Candidatus Sulfopaludibacter sp. SbA3]|nr:hypothetical protein SBA3_4730004 [Candidatus Sulfopaludibacter sp. SbA3]
MIDIRGLCGRLPALAIALQCLPGCPAQDAVQPQFEVASVKMSAANTTVSRFRPTGGTIDGRNVVLKLLLNYAYGVEGFNISGGPTEWRDSISPAGLAGSTRSGSTSRQKPRRIPPIHK